MNDTMQRFELRVKWNDGEVTTHYVTGTYEEARRYAAELMTGASGAASVAIYDNVGLRAVCS